MCERSWRSKVMNIIANNDQVLKGRVSIDVMNFNVTNCSFESWEIDPNQVIPRSYIKDNYHSIHESIHWNYDELEERWKVKSSTAIWYHWLWGIVRSYYRKCQCSEIKYEFTSRIILCMHPVNKRRRYIVTSALIGWVHTQNDHCTFESTWN